MWHHLFDQWLMQVEITYLTDASFELELETCLGSNNSSAEAYYLSQGQPISSSNSGWCGEEAEGRWKWRGGGWEQRREVLGDTNKTKKKGCVCRSVSAWFPSLPPPAWVSLQHSPCDHIGSEAEHEGADEGADLPCRSLSSPLLLLQATLANTGNTESSVAS